MTSNDESLAGGGIPLARAIPPVPRWARPLAIVTAIIFCVSSLFPVAAGLTRDTSKFPTWWGTLDVAVAFLVAVLAIVVATVGQPAVDERIVQKSYRAYRVLLNGILALVVVFFLAGDRITWINCLTGFAWRAWLLLYILPTWLAAMRNSSSS